MVIHDLRTMNTATVKLMRRRRFRALTQLYPCPNMQWCFVNSSPLFKTIANVLRSVLKKMSGSSIPVDSTSATATC